MNNNIIKQPNPNLQEPKNDLLNLSDGDIFSQRNLPDETSTISQQQNKNNKNQEQNSYTSSQKTNKNISQKSLKKKPDKNKFLSFQDSLPPKLNLKKVERIQKYNTLIESPLSNQKLQQQSSSIFTLGGKNDPHLFIKHIYHDQSDLNSLNQTIQQSYHNPQDDLPKSSSNQQDEDEEQEEEEQQYQQQQEGEEEEYKQDNKLILLNFENIETYSAGTADLGKQGDEAKSPTQSKDSNRNIIKNTEKTQPNNTQNFLSQESESNVRDTEENLNGLSSMKNSSAGIQNTLRQKLESKYSFRKRISIKTEICEYCNKFIDTQSQDIQIQTCLGCYKKFIHRDCLQRQNAQRKSFKNLKTIVNEIVSNTHQDPTNFNKMNSSQQWQKSQANGMAKLWRCSECQNTKQREGVLWHVIMKRYNLKRQWFFYRLRVLIAKTQFKNLSKNQILLIRQLIKDEITTEGKLFYLNQKNLQFCFKYFDKIPILSPYGYGFTIWNFIMFCAISFKIFEIPLLIAFSIEIDTSTFYLYQIPLFFIFILEIFMQFNIGFIKEGLVVLNRQKIKENYLRGKFIWDLISCSFFLLSILFKDSLYGLPVLLRSHQIQVIIQNAELLLQMNSIKSNVVFIIFSLAKLLNLVFFVAHFLACGFHFTALYEENNEHKTSWIIENGFQDSTNFDRYIHSLYFSFVSMSTIGYGDISPVTILERTFMIGSTLISCAVFGYSLNVITQIISDQDRKTAEFRTQKSAIIMYMKQRQISNDLQIKVIRSFENQNQMLLSGFTQSEKILEKLSGVLVKEIKIEFYLKMLKKHSVFRDNFTNPFLNDLSLVMEEQNLAYEEILFEKNDLSSNLYIIFKGKVCLYNTTQNEKHEYEEVTLQEYDKDALIGFREFASQQNRPISAKSKEITQLIFLSWKNLQIVLRKHPLDLERFCQLQDQLKQEQDHQLHYQYKHCNFCKQYYHDIIICPYLHLYVDKRWLLKKKQIQDGENNTQNRTPLPTILDTTNHTPRFIQKGSLSPRKSATINSNINNNITINERRKQKINAFYNRKFNINNKEIMRYEAIYLRKNYLLEHIFNIQYFIYSSSNLIPYDFFDTIQQYIGTFFHENLEDQQILEGMPGIVIDNKFEQFKTQNTYDGYLFYEYMYNLEYQNQNKKNHLNDPTQSTRKNSYKSPQKSTKSSKSNIQNEEENNSKISHTFKVKVQFGDKKHEIMLQNDALYQLQKQFRETRSQTYQEYQKRMSNLNIIENFDYNLHKDQSNMFVSILELYDQAKQFNFQQHNKLSDHQSGQNYSSFEYTSNKSSDEDSYDSNSSASDIALIHNNHTNTNINHMPDQDQIKERNKSEEKSSNSILEPQHQVPNLSAPEHHIHNEENDKQGEKQKEASQRCVKLLNFEDEDIDDCDEHSGNKVFDFAFSAQKKQLSTSNHQQEQCSSRNIEKPKIKPNTSFLNNIKDDQKTSFLNSPTSPYLRKLRDIKQSEIEKYSSNPSIPQQDTNNNNNAIHKNPIKKQNSSEDHKQPDPSFNMNALLGQKRKSHSKMPNLFSKSARKNTITVIKPPQQQQPQQQLQHQFSQQQMKQNRRMSKAQINFFRKLRTQTREKTITDINDSAQKKGFLLNQSQANNNNNISQQISRSNIKQTSQLFKTLLSKDISQNCSAMGQSRLNPMGLDMHIINTNNIQNSEINKESFVLSNNNPDLLLNQLENNNASPEQLLKALLSNKQNFQKKEEQEEDNQENIFLIDFDAVKLFTKYYSFHNYLSVVQRYELWRLANQIQRKKSKTRTAIGSPNSKSIYRKNFKKFRKNGGSPQNDPNKTIFKLSSPQNAQKNSVQFKKLDSLIQ